METCVDPLQEFCLAPDDGVSRRLLVVAAHPDDDVLWAGGRLFGLSRVSSVVYVSDGAPQNPRFCREAGFGDRESYAQARRAEARAALDILGIPRERVIDLGAVDQEVALELPRLVDELVRLMKKLSPELVLTHSYEGGHPDHDASALAVHAATRLLLAAGEPAPSLLEFTSYHEHEGALRFGRFLSRRGHEERVFRLGRELEQQKLAMLRCHRTQAAVWSGLSLAEERFRTAPEYDFRRQPAPRFYYDRVDWGMSGDAFMALAGAALGELGIEGSC